MAGNEEKFNKAMNAGYSAAWDQQWDKAAQAYQQALEEFPEHPKALTSLGLALFELRRYEESQQFYLKAIQVAPDDPIPVEKVATLSQRTGDNATAVAHFLKAADLYIRRQESDKAIQNWINVTQIDPDHLQAHSYLAMVHERLGQKPQAIHEFLMIASIFQRKGDTDKAAEMIGRALRLEPGSNEARQAQNILRAGQPLPRPMRSQGGTSALRMPDAKLLNAPRESDTNLDPIAEARKKSLARLAEVLFELSEEIGDAAAIKRGSMQSIVRGNDQGGGKPNDRTRILLHLGQAIDAQSKGHNDQAMEELDQAVEAGFREPAVFFFLGLLRSGGERLESAQRNLQIAVKDKTYTLASRLLLGQLAVKLNRLSDAVFEFMEALKSADAQVVPPEQAAELRQLYEPMIEAQKTIKDAQTQVKLCESISRLLLQPNWRRVLVQAREQLPKPAPGMPPLPLAEILVQAQSSQVIDAISRIRGLAKANCFRSAMDEAFEALTFAPAYLPLHALIGDLLIQEGRTQEAITKYGVVAQAYATHGEANQAIHLLRRIVQAAPMDLNVRTRLIEQLTASGAVNEAVGEYIEMADIYYRLAELDLARKTYTTALQLAQQGGANRAWSVKLLQRMADIDMQRLDWRQALRVYEQIRTLQPDDLPIRRSIVELNLRLGQTMQAAAELESMLAYLTAAGRRSEVIPFLEELVGEDPHQAILRRALAEEYHTAGRLPEAVSQLESLASQLRTVGDRAGAAQALEAIIAMQPENAAQYAAMLAGLRSEDRAASQEENQ